MSAPTTTQNKLDDRLAELEKLTTTLSSESHATRAEVDKISTTLDRFIQQVTVWMQQSGRMNWGWFIGAIGLIATLGGLAAAPFIRDLSRQDDNITAIEAMVIQMAGSRWSRDDHDRYRDRVNAEFHKVREYSDASQAELDDYLQREIRLLDDALHHEMRMLLDEPAARLKAMEAELVRRRDELNELRNRTEANSLSIAERLCIVEKVETLERQIAEISAEQRRRTNKVYDNGS